MIITPVILTFDVTVASQYFRNSGGSVDTTMDYTPLLWLYGPMESAHPDGRSTAGAVAFAYGAGPLANGINDYSCYNSGNWHMEQNGAAITVTISDYEINIEHFPDKFTASLGSHPTYGTANVGMFSAGQLFIQQPFDKVGSTDPATYDVVNEYGVGSFVTTISDVNLSMTSISGQTQADAPGTNHAQLIQNDDRATKNVYLALPGVFDNRVYYTNAGNTDVIECGVDWSWDLLLNGRDYATSGTEIMLASGFVYVANGEEENRLQYGSTLLKFDANALELTGTNYANVNAFGCTYEVLYATKPDGSNWVDDNELKNATEDDLIYYSALPDIPAEYECVATLTQIMGPANNIINAAYATVGHVAKVKETASAGSVYMITATSRCWSSAILQDAGMTLDELKEIDWTDSDTTLSDYPAGHYNAWYPGYVKESYDESGALGTHTSSNNQGDSLLIIGYKSYITKNIEQMNSDSTIKDTYNMDYNQRVADLILQPRTELSNSSGGTGNTTTITIEDTLPEYLRYKPGSSYFGGTYSQTSASGGTQGIIIDGTLNEPDSVVNNSNGTQTLKWVIPNVTVGTPMQAIHYSVNIGTPGDEANDVPSLNTTGLTNKVRIYGDGDQRVISVSEGNYAEVGLSVVRGAASSFSKYTTTPLVDPDGTAQYKILFGNNSAAPMSNLVLMDTMPFHGDSRGSKFSGTYTISEWKLDSTDASQSLSTLQLWYTTDANYRETMTSTVSYSDITTSGNWTQVAISSDGTATGMNGKTPVAWAIVGTLAGNEVINIDLSLDLAPVDAEAGAAYVNTLSTGNRVTTSTVTTVGRTIEGLTWMDVDENGQQADSETKISGVKVTLLKLKKGGDPDKQVDYTAIDSIETGRQKDLYDDTETNYEIGRYKFTNVPAGTYMLLFDNDGSKSIALFAATAQNVGNDSTDSDGIPTYNTTTTKLAQTIITAIVLPETKDMSVALFESHYHDSGFYESVPFAFTKIKDNNTNNSLSNAVFEVYRSVHVHDVSCGGLNADTECSFIADQKAGNVFDSSVWDIDNPVCTITSDTDGKVALTGLGYGVYMLVETKAPDKYSLSNGCWILDVKPSSDKPITITASPISPSAATGLPNAFLVNEENGKDSYFLPNYLKPKIPISGGMGTIMFVVVGIMLIGMSALVFILTEKKGNNNIKHFKTHCQIDNILI